LTDREGTSTREEVTVDLDYVIFLRDFLRLNLAKQKEILGDSSSDATYDCSADHVVGELGKRGRAPTDVEEAMSLLRDWGFRPSKREGDASVRAERDCPLASAIHPKLSPSEVECPLGELVLGTVRRKHPMAQLESNQLANSGASVMAARREGFRK
jgi:hypothetical protein